ncbi:hypothetical protein RHMOL_Rhmol12G0074900 [Rhododendron molle]|uniref:Uncharacterized protein n=1 Tax=Rhododendron molle TaxID=49168 RepID=A0ACC0LFX5_RHOML|nr:hypothetical protein RHMOL_Rhmol12G0074900 [Rhododendron molle]
MTPLSHYFSPFKGLLQTQWQEREKRRTLSKRGHFLFHSSFFVSRFHNQVSKVILTSAIRFIVLRVQALRRDIDVLVDGLGFNEARVNNRSTSDIISNLPSTVTENILKGLPLRDAVRTSVLSSKWRYKWVTLPQMVFDNKFFLKGWDKILNFTPVEDHVVEFLQAQDYSEFSLNKLQKVKIHHFSGAEAEMHFVKILLAHSKVLETMVILPEHGMSAEKGFAMLKELIRFPKASLKAEVIVSETPDE